MLPLCSRIQHDSQTMHLSYTGAVFVLMLCYMLALFPPPSTAHAELAAAVRAKDFDSWGTAPACTYKGPGLPDKLGRQWGYENGESCAFRQPAAPPQQSWDQAPECSYKLSDTNSLTDKAGRRWGFEGGQSCTFKTQILSTVAPRPPPPPPPPPPGVCIGGLSAPI